MSRAERRRAERERKKAKVEPISTAESQISDSQIATAVFKRQLTDQIDRELGDKYYRQVYNQAGKDACDNSYYILMCSVAMALHDCNPKWGCEAIGKRLQLTMDWIDRFAAEYGGDLKKYISDVEECTGLKITIDSVPGGGEDNGENYND